MKRRIVIIASLIISSILLVTAVNAYIAYCNPVIVPPTPESLLKLVNEERARYGVQPLILDARFNASAQMKAEDMDKNHYFGHEGLDGRQGGTYAIKTAPGVCRIIGENITSNSNVNDAASAVRAWINSPPHHEAIIDPESKLTGFGISGRKIVEHFCYPK